MSLRASFVQCFLTVFMASFAFLASAQDNQQTPKTAEVEEISNKSFMAPALENPKPFIRKTNRIAADYESYGIVLKESERPLLSTDNIFRRFGNIVYDKTEHGMYVYIIKTPFQNEKSVKAFLDVVIKPRFESAYVVKYKKGIMAQLD